MSFTWNLGDPMVLWGRICPAHWGEVRDKAFDEWYGADISPTLISRVTNAVIDKVVEWQSRPLDPVYPIIYLDCIVLKARQDKRVIDKSIFLALGINTEGQKELMGMWIAENEGAKFWLSVLTELQNRGVEDILIACVDGLKGFPDAITLCFHKLMCNCVSCIWYATHSNMFLGKTIRR